MKDRYYFQIGKIDCLAINDGSVSGTADMLFVNAPADALAHALAEHALEPDALPSTWSCLLVKTAGKIILIDTGIGSGLPVGGNFRPILAQEGVAPEDIDIVILTHGHADHIGGATEDGKPAFPNATHIMGETEWAYWTSEAALVEESAWAADFARSKLPPLASILQTVTDGHTVVPGVELIATPGHTAGHMSVVISSNDKTLLVLADAALHPIHVEQPEWVSRMERDPQQTVATRKRVFQYAVDNNALVLAYHFPPFPSLGRIVAKDGGWAWQALALPDYQRRE